MFTSYFGMSCNPFIKNESSKYKYESNDFKEMITRLNYLKEVKGIGLFIGTPGLGKTYALKYFVDSLNKDLYKVIYINATSYMNNFEFFKIICDELDIDVGACYKTDIYNNIQNELKKMVNQFKINPIIIIDDAHLLSRGIIDNLKVLYDFDMDSIDYITLILVGYPELKHELSKNVHETINQRIIVNYLFKGLNRIEVEEYVKSRLEIANTNTDIFDKNSFSSLAQACKASPRILNTLVLNSLMLASQNNLTKINSEIVMNAKKEMYLL